MGAGGSGVSDDVRDTLDAIPERVLACTEQLDIVHANPLAARLLGQAPEDLPGTRLSDLVHTEDGKPLRSVPTDGAPGDLVSGWLRHARGVRIHVEVSAARHPSGLVFVVLHRIAERELRPDDDAERAELYRTLVERAPVGIWHFDANGIVTACNDAFSEIIGSPKHVLLGLDGLTLHDPEIVRCIRETLSGRPAHFEGQYRSATAGKLSDVRVHFAPVLSRSGEVAGGVSIVEDVTQRKAMEAQLARSDRMASVGTLAAGVAHEINNPLAYALGNVELLEKLLGGVDSGGRSEQLHRCVGDIKEGLQRVRVIVGDLRTFSRKGPEQRAVLDLARVVDSAVNMAGPHVRQRARLVQEVDDSLPPVVGDEARLGQVFMNLLINAAQAIEPGNASEHTVRVTSSETDDFVVICVQDDGDGIEADELEHIFEPFWTTKAVGEGTGLGLSICHGIVQSHGGTIRVSSTPGEGSAFSVELPIAGSSSAIEPAPPESSSVPSPGRARILVIDDEPRFTQMLAATLSETHEVVVAHGGRAGTELLLEDGRFDLVLCDVMMPDVSGPGVYEVIARARPFLARRFTFVTGGVLEGRAREFFEQHDLPRLDKPFDRQDVERMLARLRREAAKD